MAQQLYTLETSAFHRSSQSLDTDMQAALEEGKVIYCPEDVFTLDTKEKEHLFSVFADNSHKNISFNYPTKELGGLREKNTQEAYALAKIMQSYAHYSKELVETLIPHYQGALTWGRTSYRPAEIAGRALSKRKDDTRLHVDAFPATPVYGRRILRVFCNINPHGLPRVWHLGEPFAQVLQRFSWRLPPYRPFIAKCLHRLKATKTLRSAYDHYQLKLHDAMKLDEVYQQFVPKERVLFKAPSTWIVFTDKASHAALSGQFLLEQTFYLPVNAMLNPNLAPLFYWKDAGIKGKHASMV